MARKINSKVRADDDTGGKEVTQNDTVSVISQDKKYLINCYFDPKLERRLTGILTPDVWINDDTRPCTPPTQELPFINDHADLHLSINHRPAAA